MELWMVDLLLPIVFFVLPLGAGFFVGRHFERKHYASIIERERAPGQVLVFAERMPPERTPAPSTQLVSGSVVISADYFKQFVAGLRMLLGGRLNTYESLLDRARREALLRMREQAKQLGATQVFNVKLETMSISGRAPSSVSALEVLAYGTAVIPPR